MNSTKMWEIFKSLPMCEICGECAFADIEMENKCYIMCEQEYRDMEDAMSYVVEDIDLLIEEGLV